MKIIHHPPESLESLQEWYQDLPSSLPITAVQSYHYVVSPEDLHGWVETHYPNDVQKFYDKLGVNTMIPEGIYLSDVVNAIRRMEEKATLWD